MLSSSLASEDLESLVLIELPGVGLTADRNVAVAYTMLA